MITTAAAIDRETVGALRSVTVLAQSQRWLVRIADFQHHYQRLGRVQRSTRQMLTQPPNQVDENVTIGTVVGITANAFDLDATTNTITYSLSSNPDGLFQIDANTG